MIPDSHCLCDHIIKSLQSMKLAVLEMGSHKLETSPLYRKINSLRVKVFNAAAAAEAFTSKRTRRSSRTHKKAHTCYCFFFLCVLVILLVHLEVDPAVSSAFAANAAPSTSSCTFWRMITKEMVQWVSCSCDMTAT
ncbi:hypothetical protein F2Q70_00031638 [Brassica cretica]|uniref:Uncharacterized protein n=1 Tax=Brassica cretica TaxID=69181 RepID=A0A8S9HB80_BRACR|nr:hypothetical protein F2Q70_00031638 [Brassica cretica]KAF2554134.1 hypothetical protein F2Q68_00036076 [Brassica cretica]